MNWIFCKVSKPQEEGEYLCMLSNRQLVTGVFCNGAWDVKNVVAWTDKPEIPTPEQTKGADVYGYIASRIPEWDAKDDTKTIYKYQGLIVCKNRNTADSISELIRAIGLKTKIEEFSQKGIASYYSSYRFKILIA